jgi:hypothetical protein
MSTSKHPHLFTFTRVGMHGLDELTGNKGTLAQWPGACPWSLIERVQDLGTDGNVFDDCRLHLVYVALRTEGMYVLGPLEKILDGWNNYLNRASLMSLMPSHS